MTDEMLETLVQASRVPLAAVELPSGRFLAVNPPLADALRSTVDALTGSSSLDQLSPAERRAGEMGFQALADGDLTGYQAIRTVADDTSPGQAFSVWVNAIDAGGTRVGLISVMPAAERGSGLRPPPPLPATGELGDVVLGTVDGSWRVDRISQDVTALLGITPEHCVGLPVLGAIHPSDAPGFLAAVEHSCRGERSVALTLRLNAAGSQWREVSVILAAISQAVPPPLAFALIGDAAGDGPAADTGRATRLEAHMRRIADELNAAGLLPRLSGLPDLSRTARLGQLTSRELAVLTRLLDGRRPADIAADLFVSQSTVRNHLSSIYAKLRVSGQVDLIRTLGREATTNAAGLREGNGVQ
ncbi:MAG TPA: LuxR C-terminal-related transcriptional regulator [Trebonia sp.]|nr:LuxR C-terminal-related transcriptional regulator [Trebonia sp.]